MHLGPRAKLDKNDGELSLEYYYKDKLYSIEIG